MAIKQYYSATLCRFHPWQCITMGECLRAPSIPAHQQWRVPWLTYDTHTQCGTAVMPCQIIRHSVWPPTSTWAGGSTKSPTQRTPKVLVKSRAHTIVELWHQTSLRAASPCLAVGSTGGTAESSHHRRLPAVPTGCSTWRGGPCSGWRIVVLYRHLTE